VWASLRSRLSTRQSPSLTSGPAALRSYENFYVHTRRSQTGTPEGPACVNRHEIKKCSEGDDSQLSLNGPTPLLARMRLTSSSAAGSLASNLTICELDTPSA